MKGRSLSGRLVLRLLVVQAILVAMAVVAFPLVSAYVAFDDFADDAFRTVLRGELRRGPDGALALRSAGTLETWGRDRPGFLWAVVDRTTGTLLPGSSDALGDVARRLGPLLPTDGRLEIQHLSVERLPVSIRTETFPVGPVAVLTARNRFRAADVPTFLLGFAPGLLPIFVPGALAAFLAIPWTVRRSLEPLRNASRAADDIDFERLDTRLPDAAMPPELLPLVRAVNDALSRLESGAQSRRLFVANAAHELRTPVAILAARIAALPPGGLRVGLEADAQRLRILTDQLLAALRLAHLAERPREHVELTACLRGVLADSAPLALRSGRSLALEATGPVWVRADAGALQSAFANLVDNALRAEPAGGVVEVAVGDGPEVAIVDHGPGIAADDREAVFEPFWRKRQDGSGTGLGLAIVRDVVEQHGGRVRVEATPGGGATFRVTLPAAAAAEPLVEAVSARRRAPAREASPPRSDGVPPAPTT